MARKEKKLCYRYKDGRYLKSSYMGDGDYELILTETLTHDCLFPKDWELEDILECCDDIYDDEGNAVVIPITSSDFTEQEAEVNIDIKLK